MDAINPTIVNLIIFVLAIYVGYHVVWNVTPALHTPLMAVTNAISAIIIVGAMLAAALTQTPLGKFMGVAAVALAAVNVFGGFLVTRLMLEMFKKKEPRKAADDPQGVPVLAGGERRDRDGCRLVGPSAYGPRSGAHDRGGDHHRVRGLPRRWLGRTPWVDRGQPEVRRPRSVIAVPQAPGLQFQH
jgi:NAD(P) transhydrogenase subunit alpha